MKRLKLATIFALSAMLAVSCGSKNDEKKFNEFELSDLPQLAVGDSVQGVAAPFAGVLGSDLVVAGGCNFPEIPAAEGGVKRFYADIFALDLSDPHGWLKLGELPKPLAYGATVAVPEGLVCIGGTSDGKTSESGVFLLKPQNLRTSEPDKLKSSEPQNLPPLPAGLDQHAAAYHNGVIYVAGGQTDGKPNEVVYALDYGKNAREWTIAFRSDDIGARLQPCLVVQNGEIGQKLYLFGGFDPSTKKCSEKGIAWNLKTKTAKFIPQHPTPNTQHPKSITDLPPSWGERGGHRLRRRHGPALRSQQHLVFRRREQADFRVGPAKSATRLPHASRRVVPVPRLADCL